MTFSSVDDEVFYCLQGLDYRSDLLNLFPMAAYVVRADGVVIWYNARAAELWGREPAVGDTDERFSGAHTLYNPDRSHMAYCTEYFSHTLSYASLHRFGCRIQDRNKRGWWIARDEIHIRYNSLIGVQNEGD